MGNICAQAHTLVIYVCNYFILSPNRNSNHEKNESVRILYPYLMYGAVQKYCCALMCGAQGYCFFRSIHTPYSMVLQIIHVDILRVVTNASNK